MEEDELMREKEAASSSPSQISMQDHQKIRMSIGHDVVADMETGHIHGNSAAYKKEMESVSSSSSSPLLLLLAKESDNKEKTSMGNKKEEETSSSLHRVKEIKNDSNLTTTTLPSTSTSSMSPSSLPPHYYVYNNSTSRKEDSNQVNFPPTINASKNNNRRINNLIHHNSTSATEEGRGMGNEGGDMMSDDSIRGIPIPPLQAELVPSMTHLPSHTTKKDTTTTPQKKEQEKDKSEKGKFKVLKSSCGGKLVRITIVQEPLQGKALGFQQRFGSFLDPALILCLEFHGESEDEGEEGGEEGMEEGAGTIWKSTRSSSSSSKGEDEGGEGEEGITCMNEGQRLHLISGRFHCHLQLMDGNIITASSGGGSSSKVESVGKESSPSPAQPGTTKGGDRSVLDMVTSLALRSTGTFPGSGATLESQYTQPFHDNFKSSSHPVVPLLLHDPFSGREKVYFIFGEMSVRCIGLYKIRIRVLEMGSITGGLGGGNPSVPSTSSTTAVKNDTKIPTNKPLTPATEHHEKMIILETDSFRVLSPRDYPGNLKATQLSKSFASQGVLFLGRIRQ